jgi:hypothetical protein
MTSQVEVKGKEGEGGGGFCQIPALRDLPFRLR